MIRRERGFGGRRCWRRTDRIRGGRGYVIILWSVVIVVNLQTPQMDRYFRIIFSTIRRFLNPSPWSSTLFDNSVRKVDVQRRRGWIILFVGHVSSQTRDFYLSNIYNFYNNVFIYHNQDWKVFNVYLRMMKKEICTRNVNITQCDRVWRYFATSTLHTFIITLCWNGNNYIF